MKKKTSLFTSTRALLQRNLPSEGAYPYENHKERGYIIWPEGVTGSLTHKNNFAAFVISKKREEGTYGIDLEEVKVTQKIFDRITTHEERALLLGNWKKKENLTLLYTLTFSMKESLFKAFSQDQEVFFPKIITDCLIENFDPDLKTFEGSFSRNTQNVRAQGEFFFILQKDDTGMRREMVLTLCRKKN